MTQARSTAGPRSTARGEIVGICDTGLDVGSTSPAHPDFAGRVKWVKSYPITPDLAPYINNPGADDGAADLDSGHGTHVAGSAVGDGAASAALQGRAPIRSMAYGARLVFQAVEQALDWKSQANLQRYGRYLLAGIPADITTIFADAYAKGARVHSNSWGGGEPGVYDGQCRQLDQFVWDHPAMCVVVAAGNDGTDADSDGQINLGSVTSPGTAKNCITVGACENLRHNFDGETYGGWWPRDYPAAPVPRRADGRRPRPGRRVLQPRPDRGRADKARRPRAWHLDPVHEVDDAQPDRDRLGAVPRLTAVLLHGRDEHGHAADVRRRRGAAPAPAPQPRHRQPDGRTAEGSADRGCGPAARHRTGRDRGRPAPGLRTHRPRRRGQTGRGRRASTWSRRGGSALGRAAG